ncbi:hypothetical protein [Natronoarchaeum rubrum]|uniref:hypothetical protein n=1 Tax=Natronoarchaeum rubrum TaxID=755311 RepID=UPI0021117852|nr:hypothetical protein [Natronoarchaeum rubrum]
MARRVALLGAALIVAGLLVAGVQTGGFDQVDADRGVSVEVASQSAAYLAVEETYDDRTNGGEVTDCWIPFFGCFGTINQETSTLQNRYVEDYTSVQVEISGVEGATAGTFEITAQPSQLAEGRNGAVEIGCADNSDGTGTATITFEMSATSQNASIAGATTTVDAIQYDCRG